MQWWEDIDREAVIEKVRQVLPAGGCVVVRGDVQDGNQQAMNLAASFAATFGYEIIRLLPSAQPCGLRQVLFRIWSRLGPKPAPHEIPPWVARLAVATEREVIDALNGLILNRKPRPALFIDDIDRDVTLLVLHCSQLQLLAKDGGIPMVISSRRSAGSHWDQAGAAPIDLGPFTREQVWSCLLKAAPLAAKTPSDLQDILDYVCSGMNPNSLAAALVYTRLEAVTA
jgi:hypothetical protein